MLAGQAFETGLGQAHQLGITQGVNAGGVWGFIQQRHLAHRLAGADIADQVRATQGAIAKRRQGAGAHQIEGVGIITLAEQHLPRGQAEPLNFVLDRLDGSLLDTVEEGQE